MFRTSDGVCKIYIGLEQNVPTSNHIKKWRITGLRYKKWWIPAFVTTDFLFTLILNDFHQIDSQKKLTENLF